MNDVLKDKNLHDIIELKAQSVIYKVDFVKTLDGKNGLAANTSESEQIEFQQLSSSANKTTNKSKDDSNSSIRQVLEGCKGVRLSVLNHEEFNKVVDEESEKKKEEQRLSDLSSSMSMQDDDIDEFYIVESNECFEDEDDDEEIDEDDNEPPSSQEYNADTDSIMSSKA